jgi:tetratricopeptide (TPR) repeat protein
VNQPLRSIQSLDPASQQQLRQAVMLQRSGQLDEAQAIFLRLLARFPDHSELLNFLGVLLLSRRDFKGAERALGRARVQAPGRPGIDYLYGMALEGLSRHQAAIPVLEAALTQMPDILDIYLRLSRCYSSMERADDALAALDRALERWPDDPELLSNIGIFHASHRDATVAIEHFERALEVEPNFPGAWVNLAKLHRRMDQMEASDRALDQALALDPDFVPALLEQARRAGNRSEYEGQLKILTRVFELDLENSEAYLLLGRTRAALFQYTESRDAYLRALEISPYDAKVHSEYGRALTDMNQSVEALVPLERAVELNPQYGDGWVGLVHVYEFLNRIDEAQAALAHAEELSSLDRSMPLARAKVLFRDKRYQDAIDGLDEALADRSLPEFIETRFHYELAKQLDRLGDSARAFQELQIGNSQMAAKVPVSMQPGNNSYLRRTRALADIMTPQWVSDLGEISRQPLENGWQEPVFLIGFPRSGTTLLDQVLDAHPDVTVVEEKPTVDRIYEGLLEFGELPQSIADMTDEQAAVLRAAYYEEMRRYAEPGASRVLIDKMPLCTSKVPILMRVLPGARFIMAIRHPADACLSCYMQDFGINMAMANFLHMEHTVALYSAVMDVWRKSVDLLQPDFVRVRYEDLVDDLETEAARVIEFLGVDWDPVVLDPSSHAKTRKISTPSYRQVSQPIYRDARYRWERYREELGSCLSQLAPYAEYFDYLDPTQPPPATDS